MTTGIGVLVTQSDPTNMISEGKITRITASKSSHKETTGYSLNMLYKNTGTTYQFGTGWFEITDQTGNKIANINVDRFFVLPEGQVLLSAFLPEKLSPGKYLVLGVVDTGSKDLIAGQQLLVVKEE